MKLGWGIGIIAVVTIIFWWQFTVKGLIPIPGDLMIGAYYPWLNQKWGYKVAVPVKNPMTSDAISQFYPWKKIVTERWQKGEGWNWDRSNFGGMNLSGNIQAGTFNPANIMGILSRNFAVSWGVMAVIQTGLAISAGFLLMRIWGRSQMAALIGGIGYGLSGQLIMWSEYGVHGWILGSWVLALACIEKAMAGKEKYWGYAAVIYAWGWLAGYPQMMYYVYGYSALLVGWRSWQNRQRRQIVTWAGKWLGAAVAGIGLAAIQLIPGAVALRASIRDSDRVARQFAVEKLPAKQLITGLIPDWYGNPGTGNYRGAGTYESFSFYASAALWVWAAIALRRGRKHRETGWLIMLGGVSILLALKTPLTAWIHNLDWLGLKGATAVRGLFGWGLALSGLAAVGWDRRREGGKEKWIPGLLIMVATGWAAIISGGEKYVILRNCLWPGLIIGAAGIIGWADKRIKIAGWLLMGLVGIDMFRFGGKYLPFTAANLVYPKTAAIAFLQQQPPGRILIQEGELMPANSWSMYGLESWSGYDIMLPKTNGWWITTVNHGQADKELSRFMEMKNFNSPLVDVSDGQYLIYLRETGDIIQGIKEGRWEKVFTEGPVKIVKNRQNLSRVFTVRKTIPAQDEGALKTVINLGEKIRQTAVWDKEEEKNWGACQVNMKVYQKEKAIWVSQCEESGYLVIAEPASKNWKFTINGKTVTADVVNGWEMGVEVPRGESEIRGEYKSRELLWGALISAGVMGLGLGFERRSAKLAAAGFNRNRT